VSNCNFFCQKNLSEPVWRLRSEQRHGLAREYSSSLPLALSIRLQEQAGQVRRGNSSGSSLFCRTEYLKRLAHSFLAAVCETPALVITQNVPYGKRFDCSVCCCEQNKKKKEKLNLKNANGICMPKEHSLWLLLLPEIWADLSPVQGEIRAA